MIKGEAEKAIRALCHQWREGLTAAERKHPSFDSFKSWLHAKGVFALPQIPVDCGT